MGTASQVLVGDVTVYVAPANTAIPAFATTGHVTPPTTPWIKQGFTESGVTLTVDRKNTDIRAEEQSTPVLVVPDTTDVTIDLTLLEDVLANASVAYGGATISQVAAGTGVPAQTVLTLAEALSSYALAFVGTNSFGFDRLFYVPEVIAGGKVKTSYRRAKAARMYPVSFTAVCALADITTIDATAVGT